MCVCMQLWGHYTKHVPGTYRSGRKLSFLWLNLTSQAAADRQNSTVGDPHWSTSRYKRCFHGNLFQLCCYPLTVHLVSTFCSKFHCFPLFYHYLFIIFLSIFKLYFFFHLFVKKIFNKFLNYLIENKEFIVFQLI